MLDRITPVILTFNEAPNIERTLARLDWASRIVIVDSGSMDETVELARRNPRVDLRERPFDEHARQWNYAITETNVRSEWVLALDADYVLTEDFLGEISRLDSHPDVTGYEARFIYYVFGQPLRGSLYPPVTVLFRAGRGHYVQDGHTQRLVVAGQVECLHSPILHDDRKPLAEWLCAQDSYMRIEARHLAESSWARLGWADRARKTLVLGPPLVLVYCLVFKGCLLDGRIGWFYAIQRFVAEFILVLHMLRRKLTR